MRLIKICLFQIISTFVLGSSVAFSQSNCQVEAKAFKLCANKFLTVPEDAEKNHIELRQKLVGQCATPFTDLSVCGDWSHQKMYDYVYGMINQFKRQNGQPTKPASSDPYYDPGVKAKPTSHSDNYYSTPDDSDAAE